MGRETPKLPIPVARALGQLGADIRNARLRRGLRAAVERGDPGVGLGIYATVLWVLGLVEPLGTLAAPATDLVGMALDEERLPQRVRVRKPKAGK